MTRLGGVANARRFCVFVYVCVIGDVHLLVTSHLGEHQHIPRRNRALDGMGMGTNTFSANPTRAHTHTHTRTRLNQFVNKKLLTFAHYTFDMLFVLFWGLMGLYVLVHVWCLSVLCLCVLVHVWSLCSVLLSCLPEER